MWAQLILYLFNNSVHSLPKIKGNKNVLRISATPFFFHNLCFCTSHVQEMINTMKLLWNKICVSCWFDLSCKKSWASHKIHNLGCVRSWPQTAQQNLFEKENVSVAILVCVVFYWKQTDNLGWVVEKNFAW